MLHPDGRDRKNMTLNKIKMQQGEMIYTLHAVHTDEHVVAHLHGVVVHCPAAHSAGRLDHTTG
jgi:hypothetical protein